MAEGMPSRRVEALIATMETYWQSLALDWMERRHGTDACDFWTHDLQDEPLPGYVDILQRYAVPRRRDWFGYNPDFAEVRRTVALSIQDWYGLRFDPEDVQLTNGGQGALVTALKTVTDPGDEIIINMPPWFAYHPICLEAGLATVDVPARASDFDLDIEAIKSAITPKTRAIIVNTPNNPTGRVYPGQTLKQLAEVLDEASVRNGRRIYLISDEAYQRILFDGRSACTPAEFYPFTFICYSFGKTLLAPGERVGYVAVPASMPDRERLRLPMNVIRHAAGYLIPNVTLHRAVPELIGLGVDMAHLQRKRDRMLEGLREIGYDVHTPEGTFYLLPKSPWPDDWAFCSLLADELDVYTMPGEILSVPGHFRISITAPDDMIERSLPRFRTAFERASTAAAPAGG